MPYGLEKKVIEQISAVFSSYPEIRKVILYGSRAKGNFKPGSDIDLTLKGDQLDLSLLSKLSDQLDDLLLPYTFDLSIFSHIDNPDLRDHIARVGVTFYSS